MQTHVPIPVCSRASTGACADVHAHHTRPPAGVGQVHVDPELGYALDTDIMRELYDHGPVACSVDANWMLHYPDECHAGDDTACELDKADKKIGRAHV